MYVTIDLPPGISRTGTKYKSKGRFYDANLVRWWAGTLGPVGGWMQHSTSAVSGKARAMLAWRDNNRTAWAAVGTHTGLYIMTLSGTVYDVTPDGFRRGRADAIYGSGYGTGPYGRGTYGTPRDSTYRLIDASVWSLGNWGQYLVGVMAGDGTIYQWGMNTATKAQPVENAPSARAVVVTQNRIMMALGAAGDPRRIDWSDQADNTVWTETATNYAGTFNLQTPGKIVCGLNIDGGTLIFTDVDIWLAEFQGQPLIYSFNQKGHDCGVIAQNVVVGTNSGVFWMGRNGFFMFNGFVNPLDCEVQDYVFSDLNKQQVSKIHAVHNSAFNEIWWFYPSSGSSEINRYVVFNYKEGHWNIGQMARLCGADQGVFANPLMVGTDGLVYDHESGWSHGGTVPYAKTGPLEVGQGDNLFSIEKVIPDANALGVVQIGFDAHLYPMRDPVSFGPYALTDQTDVRLTARQVEITFTGVDGQFFRVGSFRLDGKPRGKR